MMPYQLHLTIVMQTLADGLYLGELLGFSEFSNLGSNDLSLEKSLRESAKGLAADDKARDLYQRQTTGKAELLTLQLDIAPPKRTEAWTQPVGLTFHAVRYKRPDGFHLAYLPALQIAVVAADLEELKKRLAKEIRFALQRTGRSKSLAELAKLPQFESVELRHETLALELKSPKAQAQEEMEHSEDAKSVLEEVATDLCKATTAPARDFSAAYEIDGLIERLVDALAGHEPRSVLLVGKSGVGKTAAVHELVRRRAALQLAQTPFWATSGASLIGGAMGFGMWQERCGKLIREASGKRAILYLGNLVELLEIGKSNASNMGIAGFLRPAIARGQLLVITECTPEQLTLLERQDPHLVSAFRQLPVDEPPRDKVRSILEQVAAEYPAPLIDGVLDVMDRLHRRFGAYSAFPGRIVRFMRNLLQERQPDQAVQENDVLAAFAAQTGLPRFMLDDDVPLDLDEARHWFTSRLIGQSGAVDMVVDLIATVKAELSRPRRPIASLMFIGPTGVGKTEMAKALAEYFFSDRARLTRYDMSEYATPFAVTRLVGNFGQEEGLLTAAVRQQPFSVILLDEVEKADASLFDLLLQVFGEGRLTDASGRLADFSNSIVIMTSNLGAESFGRESFGLSRKAARDAGTHFVEEVRGFLRPELFNRIDRIIPFLPLCAEAIRRITDRELGLIRQRDGIKLRNVDVRLTSQAAEHLAQTGYDPRYGARPLKRAIERELLAPLCELLNTYTPEMPLVASVDRKEGHLAIRVRAATEVARSGTMGHFIPERTYARCAGGYSGWENVHR